MSAPRRVVETRDVTPREQRDRAVADFLKRRLREKRAEGWQHISDKPLDEYVGDEQTERKAR